MNFIKKGILGLTKKMKFLPQELYAKIHYEYYYNKKLDLNNPVEFNEKIQWLKVYYHPKILNKLVDKYEVREYIKDKIGGQYLNEIYNLYNSAGEVNFSDLPTQFVLKTTHGYNNNIIVRDKNKMNKTKSRYLLHKWMFRNQYYNGGQEWAYKDVPHRIIAEKYLPEIDNKGLSDIKFYCFNGIPEFIEVTSEIESEVYWSYFDTQWNPLDLKRKTKPRFQKEVKRPKKLEKMVEIAGKLAENFPFVRVDIYDINDRILFGELTFYPADARFPFEPEQYNKIYGDKIKLPKIPEGQNVITEI